MENLLQIILYVAIGIIWVLTKVFGKNNNNAPNTSTPPISQNMPSGNEGSTLQERTKSIRQTANDVKKQAEQKRTQVEQKLPRTRQSSEQKRREIPSQKAKPITYKPTTTESVESYERDSPYEQKLSTEFVPTYTNEAADVDYEDPSKASYQGLDDRKKRFQPFEQRKDAEHSYATWLRSPGSAKTAFVLSEILKKKYN